MPVIQIGVTSDIVALSPDDTLAVFESGGHSVGVLDIETGRQVRSLEGHLQDLRCFEFSPDGRYLASHDDSGALIVWDLSTGRAVSSGNASKARHCTSLTGVPWRPAKGFGVKEDQESATSPDGRWAARFKDGGIELTDRTSGKSRQIAWKGYGMGSLAWSPSSRHLAIVGFDVFDQGLWLLEPNEGKLHGLSMPREDAAAVGFGEGWLVTDTGGPTNALSVGERWLLWDVSSGSPVRFVDLDRDLESPRWASWLGFTPDGQSLVWAGIWGPVFAHRLGEEKKSTMLASCRVPARTLHTKGGHRVALVCGTTAHIVDLETQQKVAELNLDLGEPWEPLSARLGQRGERLAVTYWTPPPPGPHAPQDLQEWTHPYTVALWAVPQGTVLSRFSIQGFRDVEATLTPDEEKVVATLSRPLNVPPDVRHVLIVWDAERGTELLRIDPAGKAKFISPDSQRIVTRYGEMQKYALQDTYHVYDLTSGQRLGQWRRPSSTG